MISLNTFYENIGYDSNEIEIVFERSYSLKRLKETRDDLQLFLSTDPDYCNYEDCRILESAIVRIQRMIKQIDGMKCVKVLKDFEKRFPVCLKNFRVNLN